MGVLAAERMTFRARLYLYVVAGSHLLIGMAATFAPEQFESSSFDQIRMVTSHVGGMRAWGLLYLTSGLLCLIASRRNSTPLARCGLIFAAACNGMWSAGFFAAALAGTLASPTGPIAWGALTLRDLIVCRQPLRTPLEDAIRRVVDKE